MDLGTIEITKEEAEARVAEYEAVLASERSVEDQAILQAYRAAKRGLPVISLKRAFNTAGLDEMGLPNLAIVRADATKCWVTSTNRTDGTRFEFSDREWSRSRGALVGRNVVRVDTELKQTGRQRWRGSAVVPLIPPRCRPKRGRISNFHILWEVEGWNPEPPRDPALLKHLRGDMWTVMAVWDLTPLEQMVLTQRA